MSRKQEQERAHSPPPPLSLFLPPEYADLSVEKVEKVLGPIKRLSQPFYKKFFITPPVDPYALDAARKEIYELEYQLRRLEVEKKMREASSAPNPNANAGESHTSDNPRPSRPRGYPPFPITSEDLNDAEMQVRHIQMYGQYRDHIKKSNALRIAENHLERLQRQFAVQERDFPGAYKFPHYNTESKYAFSAPPLTQRQRSLYPPDSGGKSKRSKRSKRSNRSKRSKTCKNRVHKRRN